MAFDRARIEKTFKEDESYPYMGDFLQSPTFQIVSDYLTGANSGLNGLSTNYQMQHLILLWSLLEDVENPTANDQLIWNVLFHPDVIPISIHNLSINLVQYLVDKNTDKSIQTLISRLQQAGYRNTDIFTIVINYMIYSENSHEAFTAKGSPLKNFLVKNIPSQLIVTTPYHWSGYWNQYYFMLLEELRPHLIKEYIVSHLLYNQEDSRKAILLYKDGKYHGLVTEWIMEPPSNYGDVHSRLATAIELNEISGGKYQNLVYSSSSSYIEFYKTLQDQKWETSIISKEFEHTDNLNPLRFSAAAIHYIFQKDSSEAMELISQLFKSKTYVSMQVLQIIHHHLKDGVLPFLKLALKTENVNGGLAYYKEVIDFMEMNFETEEYIIDIWGLVTNKSKSVKHMIAEVLSKKDPEAEKKAISLLQNKNAEARQTAAIILSHISSSTAIAAIKEMIDAEINDNARDTLLQIVENYLPKQPDEVFIKQMIAAAQTRNKLNKPVEPWLEESELPNLYYVSGEMLTANEVRFLLYRMSRVKTMCSDPEARYIINLLDKQKSGDFAKQILKLYIDKGAASDQKYLLALISLLGNEDIVDKLRTTINKWIDENRLKMAEHGIGALAIQGSDKALRWVEWYSRKFKSKKANVGAAAQKALEDAASELGISIHELGDRVVPDFGFNGLFKEFTIDGDDFRAFIDSKFKLCFFDENNKKLKALPSAASIELKEEFKVLGKEIRDVVKSQSNRLEHYLITQRRWKKAEWQKVYLENPVMFIYATKILWGIYNDQGLLMNAFICLEDTTLVNLEDEEIELPDNSLIGIIHPIQLEEDQLQKWNKKFFDLSIDSIFPQLSRGIATLDTSDGEKKIILDFADRQMQPGAIKTTLEKQGWRHSGAIDGGFIEAFHMENTNENILAVLEVAGVFVGYGFDHEPKLGKLYFIHLNEEKNRWHVPPKDEKDPRLVALKDLPPIFYSEVIMGIGLIRVKE